MPVLIRISDGRSCPVFGCDHCVHPIVKPNEGLLLWQEVGETSACAPSFVHSQCLADFEFQRPGLCLTADLDTAMVNLGRNLGMDERAWEHARWKAGMMDQF